MEKLFFLAGLPRTGSTLLTAILSQNKNILSEGSSALVELLWQNYRLFTDNENIVNAIQNTKKVNVAKNVISKLSNIYYSDCDEKYIIDKNRSWTHSGNIELLKTYVTASPKIIVMLRPITEIVESFYYIYKKNNRLDDLKQHLFNQDNPLMFPFVGLLDALKNNKNCLLLITYKELIEQPKKTIEKIYEFLEVEKFNHDFETITNKYPEGDYNLKGLHKVRTKIKARNKNVTLPKELKDKALAMQQELEKTLEAVGEYDIFKK
jgi:sulfotransferase